MAEEKAPEMATSGRTEDLAPNSKFMKTIMASEEAISQLTNECTDMVTNVQVANDMREVKRREEESKLSEIRSQFLEKEAEKTQAILDFINSKWESIAKLKDSIDIHGAYESQKNHYWQLIRQKDEVLEVLQRELDEADEKYIQDQNLHREDIQILTRRIDEHVEIMRKAYRKHLKLIENTAIEEQKSTLNTRHDEWERVNKTFEQEKVEDMNEMFKLVETYEKETIDTIWDHSEKHRRMKRDLEIQLQTLQIKVKETKTYCMLEERKLEYNYLVLSKRQEELGSIKAAQRRRINRLHDELTNLENERREIEGNHQVRCVQFESEILKLVADKEALIKKMKRIDEVNENIFYRIWKLNEKRTRKTLDKIITMDEQINNQVLHLDWTPPVLKLKTVSELPSIQLYTERIPNFKQPDLSSYQESASIYVLRNFPQLSPHYPILKFILNNIVDCMKFVIKDKIDCLIEDLDDEKRNLVKFDNVLKVLDIEKESELELLKEYFLPYIKCSTCSGKRKTTLPSIFISKRGHSPKLVHRTGSANLQRRGSTAIAKRPSSTPITSRHTEKRPDRTPTFCRIPEHKWVIDQCSVIKLLADFLQNKKQRRNNDPNFIKIPLARVLTPSDIELYWKSFKPLYVDELEKLWDILYTPLNNYLQLLKDGNAIVNEINVLKRQNSDLRRALRSFLTTDCKPEAES